MVIIQCDEHIPYSVVRGLRARGVEIFSIEEENLKSISDEDLLDYCHAKRRILLTNDRDFLVLAKEKNHSGIIYLVSQYTAVSEIIKSILQLIDTFSEENFGDALFYIP